MSRVNITKFPWDTNSTKTLLDLWEKNEIVWKKKHPKYYRTDMKKDVYTKMLKKLNASDDKNFKGLLSKMKKIKDQWMYYKKQVQKSKSSGAGTDDVYVITVSAVFEFILIDK